MIVTQAHKYLWNIIHLRIRMKLTLILISFISSIIIASWANKIYHLTKKLKDHLPRFLLVLRHLQKLLIVNFMLKINTRWIIHLTRQITGWTYLNASVILWKISFKQLWRGMRLILTSKWNKTKDYIKCNSNWAA